MLIRSLCDYYDIQSARGEAASDIMSEQPVHWMVMLTPDGRVADIIDKRIEESVPQKNGKVKIVKKPIVVPLPKRTQKTGIDANIIEHRPLYIFGLNYDAKIGLTPDDKTGKARKSHEAFVKKNLEFFEGIDSEIARAYVNFIKNWVPENETENEQLKKLGKEYQGSYYIFALDGRPECKLHKDKAVLAKYEGLMAKAAAEHPASMLAVMKLDNAKIEEICKQFKQVYPVNYNAPGQLVVAGTIEEMDAFKQAVREAGGRGLPIAVGGGFHSPFMDGASREFSEDAREFELRKPALTVYSNFTTEPYTESVLELMENQINHSLRWQESMERMAADGFDTFIEVGIGDTLKKLIKRILPEARVYSVSNMEEIEKVKEEMGC